MAIEHKLYYKQEMQVRWGDMDAAQHVNNTVYHRYLESARVGLFAKLSGGQMELAEHGPILAYQDCKFIFPLTFPDTAIVEYDVYKVESDRIQCQAQIYSKAHNRLSALSKSTIMAYNFHEKKKVDIPQMWLDAIREAYGEVVF